MRRSGSPSRAAGRGYPGELPAAATPQRGGVPSAPAPAAEQQQERPAPGASPFAAAANGGHVAAPSAAGQAGHDQVGMQVWLGVHLNSPKEPTAGRADRPACW